MPKIKVRTKDQKVYDKLVEAFEKTVIVQKQKQLTYGRWDFVVFGQTDKNETVLREGYAEQASIKRVPIYIASLAQPGLTNVNGIPIEEFIEEDVPEQWQQYTALNAEKTHDLPVITEKKEPLAQDKPEE